MLLDSISGGPNQIDCIRATENGEGELRWGWDIRWYMSA